MGRFQSCKVVIEGVKIRSNYGAIVQTWNDSLQLCTHSKASQCVFVCCNDIFGAVGILEPSVFGSYAWIIQACTDRVRLNDLASRGLQKVCPDTVKYSGTSQSQSGTVSIRIYTC